MWTIWLLTCSCAFISPPKTWKKYKGLEPQQNEMLSLYCIALGFISKNEEYWRKLKKKQKKKQTYKVITFESNSKNEKYV